jgi:hypothetical protein
MSRAQRKQSTSPAGSRYEFNLQSVEPVDLDDRTEIAVLESMLRKVAVENNDV